MGSSSRARCKQDAGTLRVAVKTLPAMTRDPERQAFTDEFKKHMHAARHSHDVCFYASAKGSRADCAS